MELKKLTLISEISSDHPSIDKSERIIFYKEDCILLCSDYCHFLIQIDFKTFKEGILQILNDRRNEVKLQVNSQSLLVLEKDNLGDPYQSGVLISLVSVYPIKETLHSVFVIDKDLIYLDL